MSEDVIDFVSCSLRLCCVSVCVVYCGVVNVPSPSRRQYVWTVSLLDVQFDDLYHRSLVLVHSRIFLGPLLHELKKGKSKSLSAATSDTGGNNSSLSSSSSSFSSSTFWSSSSHSVTSATVLWWAMDRACAEARRDVVDVHVILLCLRVVFYLFLR